MNNRHLRIFIRVYEEKNMTLAAESLYISQPSVSQAVKELEEHYGVKLFERYPKQLFPTAEGDLLYRYAKQVFGLMQEIEKEIPALSERGTIAIGANISAGTVLLRRYIKKFSEEFPDAKVKVTVAGSTKLKSMIYDHTVDLALMEDLPNEPALVQESFYKDRLVLVCSPDNKLAGKRAIKFKDLRGQEFLLRAKGVGVRDRFDYIMNLYDMEVEPLWESSNTRSLINAAMDGLGIAVLPYLLVKKEIDRGSVKVLDVKEELLHRNLNIVYHKDKIFNRWLTRFAEIVRTTDPEV